MTDKEKQLQAKEFDPGWNDPPLFSFESREAHSRQCKSATLNKRVVFPSSSSVGKQQAENKSDGDRAVLTSSSAPPKLPVGGPPKVALVVLPSVSTVQDQESGDNVRSLDVLHKNFDDVLYQVYSQEENKEVEEIKKRLAVMENMWKDGKFNTLVKGNLLKLSLGMEVA
ncbi:uncharacterized protein isoform X3 [Rhodnius prolixus]|uniref:uncharacterized protein isoform X3 n=1 Tax=Rhodnius prolixus TaxID=13249 RepID=UPI003D18BBAB